MLHEGRVTWPPPPPPAVAPALKQEQQPAAKPVRSVACGSAWHCCEATPTGTALGPALHCTALPSLPLGQARSTVGGCTCRPTPARPAASRIAIMMRWLPCCLPHAQAAPADLYGPTRDTTTLVATAMAGVLALGAASPSAAFTAMISKFGLASVCGYYTVKGVTPALHRCGRCCTGPRQGRAAVTMRVRCSRR